MHGSSGLPAPRRSEYLYPSPRFRDDTGADSRDRPGRDLCVLAGPPVPAKGYSCRRIPSWLSACSIWRRSWRTPLGATEAAGDSFQGGAADGGLVEACGAKRQAPIISSTPNSGLAAARREAPGSPRCPGPQRPAPEIDPAPARTSRPPRCSPVRQWDCVGARSLFRFSWACVRPALAQVMRPGKPIADAGGTLGAQVAGEAAGCPAFTAHAGDHGRRRDAGDPQVPGERCAPGQVGIAGHQRRPAAERQVRIAADPEVGSRGRAGGRRAGDAG